MFPYFGAFSPALGKFKEFYKKTKNFKKSINFTKEAIYLISIPTYLNFCL